MNFWLVTRLLHVSVVDAVFFVSKCAKRLVKLLAVRNVMFVSCINNFLVLMSNYVHFLTLHSDGHDVYVSYFSQYCRVE